MPFIIGCRHCSPIKDLGKKGFSEHSRFESPPWLENLLIWLYAKFENWTRKTNRYFDEGEARAT